MGLTPEGMDASYVIILDPSTDVAAGSPSNPFNADPWFVKADYQTVTNNQLSWVVPTNYEWHIAWLHVRYTSDANAGNRQLVLEVQHAGAPMEAELARARVTQAASLTYEYLFAPGVGRDTAVYDTDYLTADIPVTSVLLAGDRLRIFDNNAVSVLDTIEAWLQYGEKRVA